ncbi:MAG: shikimate dehydrogenase [Anaerolineales bacterium]
MAEQPPLLATPSEPTMYFIGVRTGGSAIHQIFPRWAECLAIEGGLVGVDIPLSAEPEKYRSVVRHIQSEKLARGALVTSHKVHLYQSSQDMIEHSDRYASHLSEASCLAKEEGELHAFAFDPITTIRALKEMRHEPFPDKAEALSLGAGGAGLALAAGSLLELSPAERPSRVHLVDREPDRLAEVEKALKSLGCDLRSVEFHRTSNPQENDGIIARLPPESVIVNATGMGKNTPGSPVTIRVDYPEMALVWELNYRGPRPFLYDAMAKAEERNLLVEDGWRLFVINWGLIISKIFGRPLQPGDLAKLAEIAEPFKPSAD